MIKCIILPKNDIPNKCWSFELGKKFNPETILSQFQKKQYNSFFFYILNKKTFFLLHSNEQLQYMVTSSSAQSNANTTAAFRTLIKQWHWVKYYKLNHCEIIYTRYFNSDSYTAKIVLRLIMYYNVFLRSSE